MQRTGRLDVFADEPRRAGAARRRGLLWVILTRDRAAAVGAVLIAGLLALAVVGPWFAPYDPTRQDLQARRATASREHLLGTDEFGRDLLSRVLVGARYTLAASVVAVGIGTAAGASLGLAMGYFGGRLDRMATRFVDMLLAFPYLLLAIVVVGVLGPSLQNAVLAVGITSLPIYVRVARAATLVVRQQEFVAAALAIGGSHGHTIRRLVLPNVLGPVVVTATVGMAHAVHATAGLSFLGLGAQPPVPEWGAMLSSGRNYLLDAPHVATVPGIAIVVAMLGFNLLGDALRDALDPRMR
ncbi:MAG: ABC transporter permease [Armatimonadetes bacterium]|nr:ABC transporter permease [Armatimonadota bacterium]